MENVVKISVSDFIEQMNQVAKIKRSSNLIDVCLKTNDVVITCAEASEPKVFEDIWRNACENDWPAIENFNFYVEDQCGNYNPINTEEFDWCADPKMVFISVVSTFDILDMDECDPYANPGTWRGSFMAINRSGWANAYCIYLKTKNLEGVLFNL